MKRNIQAITEWITPKAPTNLQVTLNLDILTVKFDMPKAASSEMEAIQNLFTYKALLYPKGAVKGDVYTLERASLTELAYSFIPVEIKEDGTEYVIRLCASYEGKDSEWSEPITFKKHVCTKLSGWKQFNDCKDMNKLYTVDKVNKKTVKFIGDTNCTITGNSAIPDGIVMSWTIYTVCSLHYNCDGMYFGVAPIDIDRNEDSNQLKCGWYIGCYDSRLYSVPPHNYRGVPYGVRKDDGRYVFSGDRVGVKMDTIKGELSFIVNFVDSGIAYTGIPIDRPLTPCVILGRKNDSVELVLSEVNENVNLSIPVPGNIVASSEMWNSITFRWNPDIGNENVPLPAERAFQIVFDGVTEFVKGRTAITKKGLLPGSEHTFRVRTVVDNTVGCWSGVVIGRVHEMPKFAECIWKECPGNENKGYSVNRRNPKVVSRCDAGDMELCTVIGTSPLPPNKMVLWDVKVKKIRDSMFIGAAPFDIDFGCRPQPHKVRVVPWLLRLVPVLWAAA